jgi:hypothetical protein
MAANSRKMCHVAKLMHMQGICVSVMGLCYDADCKQASATLAMLIVCSSMYYAHSRVNHSLTAQSSHCHFLLCCYCCLAESQKWASTNGSGSGSCVSAFVPFLKAYVRLCNIRAWLVGLLVACGAARLLLLAALWLAPTWYLRIRSRIVTAVLLLDACTCMLLRSTHCSLQLPGLRCRQSLLADIGMAPSFVMWHLPLATALPYCAAYWAGSSLLHNALSPPGLASASAVAAVASWSNFDPPWAQLVRLLAQLVAPVAVLYWLEKRSRKAFVAAQAREAAGGPGLQERQPGSPVCSSEQHEKGGCNSQI